MASIASLGLGTALLKPVFALNFLTFGMEAWMYALRLPALSKYNVKVSPENTKSDFDRQLPGHVRWPADNYNHLMEQPTQFYAVAVTAALIGATDDTTVALAWTYVGLRVVHSLVQATTNKIFLRFSIFVASSATLLGLTVRAASYIF